ncbi:MAG TPA: hydrolase, partial [Gammaproteobacteria bacterium]
MAELAQRDDGGFAAPWWLRGPHLQTLYAPLLRRVEPPPRRRERLELADGDFVDLDWAGPAGDPRTPLVVLLHGLAGSSASPYLAGLQRVLAARGWGSVALNFRGASGEPNRRAHSYHSGETGD